ncbi:MAG: pepsin-like aspartyl protease, partial [Runella zeae]
MSLSHVALLYRLTGYLWNDVVSFGGASVWDVFTVITSESGGQGRAFTDASVSGILGLGYYQLTTSGKNTGVTTTFDNFVSQLSVRRRHILFAFVSFLHRFCSLCFCAVAKSIHVLFDAKRRGVYDWRAQRKHVHWLVHMGVSGRHA